MRSILFCAALIFCAASAADAQTAKGSAPGRLTVSVSGVRSDSGVVRCGLYASADGFRQPGREQNGVIAKPNDGQATCVFGGLGAGTYAVAVFHAEQNETQIEYGLLGKPKQGFGFSRNPSTTFGPPGFEAASFNYTGGNQTVPVTLHY
ncbi:MAG: DUF2141 domain-containing protein [Pseudolabrys sp.]|jgi:uncharacterized protein (DUF2141 family)